MGRLSNEPLAKGRGGKVMEAKVKRDLQTFRGTREIRKFGMRTAMDCYATMAIEAAKHLLKYVVIGTQVAMLLFVLQLPLGQCELFKASLDPLGYLEDNSTFYAHSRIECGALCMLRTNRHRCTAFILDKSTKTCTCGRKSFAAMDVNGAYSAAYVLIDCQIEVQIAGISILIIFWLF